jgi:hypothetical protein
VDSVTSKRSCERHKEPGDNEDQDDAQRADSHRLGEHDIVDKAEEDRKEDAQGLEKEEENRSRFDRP